MMKRRPFFYFLAVSIVVLLLTGIGGCYWLVRGSPLTLLQGGTQATPEAAIFVPKQAPVMVSILVNPDRLEKLRQAIARPKERRRSRLELDQIKTTLLANTGLDYRRDVQPWLGDEITAAVTTSDYDRDQYNGQQPGYLMALATKDAEKSREFLQLVFSKQAIAPTDLEFEDYKGVNLVYHKPHAQGESLQPSTRILSGAVVGDRFVLLANHPRVIKDAINNVQAPDLNLTTSSRYQQALSQLPPRRLGLAFLNLPGVISWQGLDTAQTYESQIIALEANRKGLLTETTLLAASPQEVASTPELREPVGALKYVPATSGLAIAGTDLSNLNNTALSQLWKQVAQISTSGYDAISRLINQPLANLQQRWGINLEEDIFSWVQGEYAIALLPHADTSTSDWIFVTEKSPAATEGISRLDMLARQRGYDITTLPLGEQKIAAWTQLTTAPLAKANSEAGAITIKAKVLGVHGSTDKYEILTTSVDAMDAVFKADQAGSLLNDAKFQASIEAIPQPNAGYVYLDWTMTQSLLERQLPALKLVEVIAKPLFDNLRSLTVSSYGSEPGLLKGGVFFRLNE
ncbi:DUF3352 domain-containing protein [Gloeocapsopsis sp. IPPAS B-1203]|uniref:DUF3352 domain-containing protein n=1 Tax=Gloeocapsopsis sp. IPPAS B-1203 TaxID=2049454 RepID=UPI000C1A3A04|nr:DUF3352 domain-containing protein [Gloeocapsopsis sp. IPPAS B-1203]PIG90685.1 hypothetical protein CSQ79_25315 [Gloeocapsopsis sp. IPPAS B-1203]